jgi:hypothetical protein
MYKWKRMCKWIDQLRIQNNMYRKNIHSFDPQNWDIHTSVPTTYLKSSYCGDLPISIGQLFCGLWVIDKKRGIYSTNFILQREVKQDYTKEHHIDPDQNTSYTENCNASACNKTDPTLLSWGFLVFLCPYSKMPGKYLYSMKSASSQILSNSSVINPLTIQHYIT